jgi:multisubunit Na+/H+ antiporter MnhB subunit
MIEFILIFMIAAAIIALEAKELLSSIISLGGVGFALAIIMVFLKAPDVAIVQVLVEVLLLIILIKATISRDITSPVGKKEFFTKAVGVSLILVILFIVLYGLAGLPEFGSALKGSFLEVPSLGYLSRGLEQTGSPNIVTAVLLDYRAYDTLGEATVLFAAVIGALTILRKTKKNPPCPPLSKGELKGDL